MSVLLLLLLLLGLGAGEDLFSEHVLGHKHECGEEGAEEADHVVELERQTTCQHDSCGQRHQRKVHGATVGCSKDDAVEQDCK